MKHARPDYDRIQDPAGLIPADEPVFLLRGQDCYAQLMLRIYANMVECDGGDQNVIRLTREQAARMDAWPKKKAPDVAIAVLQASAPDGRPEDLEETAERCQCFGDSGLHASTHGGPSGERLCDLCGRPVTLAAARAAVPDRHEGAETPAAPTGLDMWWHPQEDDKIYTSPQDWAKDSSMEAGDEERVTFWTAARGPDVTCTIRAVDDFETGELEFIVSYSDDHTTPAPALDAAAIRRAALEEAARVAVANVGGSRFLGCCDCGNVDLGDAGEAIADAIRALKDAQPPAGEG